MSFNNFRLVKSLIKEEKDFIIPCRWHQAAHRCCVSAIWMFRQKVTCPYWSDYFRFEAVKSSIFHPDNRTLFWALVKTLIFIMCLGVICLGVIWYNAIIVYQEPKTLSHWIVMTIWIILILNLGYLIYRLVKYCAWSCNPLVVHISARSKDGFEREISRKESKQNLYHFMKKNHSKTLEYFQTDEREYWAARVKKRGKQLIKEYELFLTQKDQDINENFDYEGIFDKQDSDKKPSAVLDRTRMDLSRYMGGLSQSRMQENSQHSMSRYLNRRFHFCSIGIISVRLR